MELYRKIIKYKKKRNRKRKGFLFSERSHVAQLSQVPKISMCSLKWYCTCGSDPWHPSALYVCEGLQTNGQAMVEPLEGLYFGG